MQAGWGSGMAGASTHHPQLPAGVSAPGGQDSVTTIQIRVADSYQVQPGVPMPASMLSGSANSAGSMADVLDLSLERQLVAQAGSSDVQAFLDSAEPSSIADPLIATYTAMGFTHDQSALSVAYTKLHPRAKDDEAVDFANNYRELTSMGYSPTMAAGALLMSENRLPEATETCLNISS